MQTKTINFLILIFSTFFMIIKTDAQENAAPSIHLTSYFPSNDAILKMQKIKIVQSANNSYFEINNFTKGYAGLQQTSSTPSGNTNILISSLWDVNTLAGIYSSVDYHDALTSTSRFGGEGDGWKTINPYAWEINTWYNLVQRSWKLNGKLYISTFINNISTGKWFHTATLSIPDPNVNLGANNDAFLENWYGYDPSWNGSKIRKAFLKDTWNLNTNGNWEKNTSAFFSANNSAADIQRNGIYHNSFNAYYDNTENAYCIQHGGNSTPSAAFNNGRTLSLPPQANQGTSPILTIGTISSVNANYNNGIINVNWAIDQYKSPQLIAKIDIIDNLNNIVKTEQYTLPEKRSTAINYNLSNGNYIAKVTIIDIFNQTSTPKTFSFTVGNGNLSTDELNSSKVLIKVTPNPAKEYLTVVGQNLKQAILFDESGKAILTASLKNSNTHINVSSLIKGLYFIAIKDENNKIIHKEKIIIE
ncbi:Por secretion system C-terminal sorting domain-containing protein [Chryseobacterium sp. RU37D]|uniref:DUF3472 domain-containing protein n=1 Tax=Chryseobacterium sp. RU37D TaxID=1907397 RepID=UPI0009549FE5|nr:DUF3472 domain-containing protein [Chryseobacterium sp. RU37D]SIP99403.1 Por secretion system C-terminal sorting domain-containing protein [Chryseobacterium sp. RU37D]